MWQRVVRHERQEETFAALAVKLGDVRCGKAERNFKNNLSLNSHSNAFFWVGSHTLIPISSLLKRGRRCGSSIGRFVEGLALLTKPQSQMNVQARSINGYKGSSRSRCD